MRRRGQRVRTGNAGPSARHAFRRASLALLALALLLSACEASRAGASNAGSADRVRIGYQKSSLLVLAKWKGTLEAPLRERGVSIEWAEFPSGPALLEALNAAQLDLGYVGEAPPIFAQAASPDMVYVAVEDPSPKSEAIIVPKGSPIDAAEMEAICAAQGVTVEPWDVVVIRTGYMGLWPDAERMAEHKTAGPDVSAARWLLERRVIAAGSDTETFEVQPAPDPGPEGNPQPVHTALLIQNGVYIMESLDLEELARQRIYEFLFVALPVKIRGATGSMVDPVAVV